MSKFGSRCQYGLVWAAFFCVLAAVPSRAVGQTQIEKVVEGGLDWLAATQSGFGHWGANGGAHPAAMTALGGVALLCEGSTTTQGKYANSVRQAVEYVLRTSQPNGLLGDPARDDRYTYGHGFGMLFLGQVLGEEEDEERRQEIYDVLCRAVTFCGQAQTSAGGWGYVSAKDGGDFDEGSTTITQVQGLRSCRDAGVPVPKEVIDKAVQYIRNCTGQDGGVRYSSKSGGGGRPAITAAAIACLFNAGEYDTEYVPRLLQFCAKNIDAGGTMGHDHYAHYYYAQVQYRQVGATWDNYRDKMFAKILRDAVAVNVGGKPCYYWPQGQVGPIYSTAINLTILQLEKGYLPIYQR